MSKVGKQSSVVQYLHKRTKINIDDICDILRLLPDATASALIHSNLPEKDVLYLGFISISWQNPIGKKPEIMLHTTKRFKETLAELKFRQETPLAKTMFANLQPSIQEKMVATRKKKGKLL